MEYLIVSNVNLRKDPRVTAFNYAGRLYTGRTVQVERVMPPDEKGMTWAALTEPDKNGRRIWFCVKSLNKTFAEPVDPPTPSGELTLEERVARLEKLAGIG